MCWVLFVCVLGLVFCVWGGGFWCWVCSGWVTKVTKLLLWGFCVEKLRNLDLYLFGTVTFVTFVTFCYMCGTLVDPSGFCLYGFLGVVALGNPPSIEAALAL